MEKKNKAKVIIASDKSQEQLVGGIIIEKTYDDMQITIAVTFNEIFENMSVEDKLKLIERLQIEIMISTDNN